MASRDVKRLTRKLQILAKTITREIEAELVTGADQIVAGQKRRAPKESGTLAASIRHSGLEQSKGEATVTIEAGGDATRAIGNSTRPGGFDYAVEQEFGNQNMAANPFFYPEIRVQGKRIRKRVRKAFSGAVRK